MAWEFLLLGLIGEGVRGYYSGKGKSGGGKFIGGKMGDDATKYDDLKKAAAGGDAEAKKQMESMISKAQEERVSPKPSGGTDAAKASNTGSGKFPAPSGVAPDALPPQRGLVYYISGNGKWNAEKNAVYTAEQYGLPKDYYSVTKSMQGDYGLIVNDKYISDKTMRLQESFERTVENWGWRDGHARRAQDRLEVSQKEDILKVRQNGKV